MVQSCLKYLNYRMIQIMRQLLHSSLEMFSSVDIDIMNINIHVYGCGPCGEKLDILSVFRRTTECATHQ